jgi:hypothetical protein
MRPLMRPSNPPCIVALSKNLEGVALGPQLNRPEHVFTVIAWQRRPRAIWHATGVERVP